VDIATPFEFFIFLRTFLKRKVLKLSKETLKNGLSEGEVTFSALTRPVGLRQCFGQTVLALAGAHYGENSSWCAVTEVLQNRT
jgi:hypothetical protein